MILAISLTSKNIPASVVIATAVPNGLNITINPNIIVSTDISNKINQFPA